MITCDKLKIFQDYNGDGDMWLKTASPWQRNKMDADDWTIIEQLFGDLKLVNKGMAAVSYVESIEAKIRENCADEKTIAKLRELSREMK
jgi:hypothetical protein